MSVEEQVVAIFAGVRGYLDGLAIADITRFETELLENVRSKAPEILGAKSARNRRFPVNWNKSSTISSGSSPRCSSKPLGPGSEGQTMSSLKELRNRIASVKSTQKITSAMKMVAASKLRRAQEQAEAARPYADRMERVLAGLARGAIRSGQGPRLLRGTGKDRMSICW